MPQNAKRSERLKTWIADEQHFDAVEAAKAAADEKKKKNAAEDKFSRIDFEWQAVERERKAGHYRQMLGHLKIIQMLDPQDARIAPAMAEAERLLNRNDRRLENAEDALRRGDWREASALAQAVAVETGHKASSVESILEKARAQSGRLERNRLEAAQALAAGRWRQAHKLYAEILAAAPDDARALEDSNEALAQIDRQNTTLVAIAVAALIAIAIGAIFIT